MRSRLGRIAVVATLVLASGQAHGDVILDWNDQLLNAVRAERTSPPRASRHMALVNVAMYDAVNGIVGTHQPYFVVPAAPPGASIEAAAAAAAHTVLSGIYPSRQDVLNAALEATLAGVPDGVSEDDGVLWGESVAISLLTLRFGDGSDSVFGYSAPEGAGWWIPTPPAFASPLLPNWPFVLPWSMKTGDQFRAPAPPPPTSFEYAVGFDEVLRLGPANGSERTPDQTETALFWDDGPGSATPPGHWQEIAQVLSQAHGLSVVENARLFALLGMAVADAAIVSWDNKYFWNQWRPVTGIVHADIDGNPATAPDTDWSSLINTPPFPTYTSGHSTFSGASSKILELFFGHDDVAFSATSDLLPGVTRSYESLSEAAEEAGQSRIYGGIHWQWDNTAALSSGRALAEHVFFNLLRPISVPGACIESSTRVCLNGGRFAVQAHWATNQGTHGAATAGPQLGDDTGTFWFFNSNNTELTVKVLDGCDVFDTYWVFASGLTNVEVTLTVTDTETGQVKTYFNPLEKPFSPIQDTSAFATCP